MPRSYGLGDSLGRTSRRSRARPILALVGVLAVAAVTVVLFRTGSDPDIQLEVGLPAIGPKTPLTVEVGAAGRGLSHFEVAVRQGEARTVLHEQDMEPVPAWSLWTSAPPPSRVELLLERSQLPDLRAEQATIEVIAMGAGTPLLSAPTSSVTRSLPLRLRPPRLALQSENVFVAQGGSEAVVYTVSETAVRHGVRAGEHFFPGYPLPKGGQGEMFALFAVPYDLDDETKVELVAVDDVGNEARVAFIDRFTPRPFKTDTINVTDRFMEAVVPRILAKTPELEDHGKLLDNYVAINSELRKKNSDTLVELSEQTAPEFLWSQGFIQMPAKVVSAFADRRTYLYEGRKVDQQDHLGFDLASVRKDAVPAANAGRVIYADYLGIYGNTVVLDHGFGLQSLYAHLSKIDVEKGSTVERGQTIGRTGATGLALGDHLHFTMLLHGLPVTPIEWWDEHWIQDRLALKLGDALGFRGKGE